MKYNYSVIVPFRNDLQLLYVGVNSIPDRKDIQIIIVDNSQQSLETQFEKKHELAEICYTTSSPTKGAGCARNVGLTKATGKWLVFLDADDFFTPEAFHAFDQYIDSSFDIVYFDMTAIFIGTGNRSNRLDYYSKKIAKGDENIMRYRANNPVGKIIRRSLVEEHNIRFHEVRVSNDAYFSLLTGYYAKIVKIDKSVVYCATESQKNKSLTKTKSPENSYIRFQEAIARNVFLEDVGLSQYRDRLLAAVVYSLKDFGPIWFFRFIKTAINARQNIFSGMNINDK